MLNLPSHTTSSFAVHVTNPPASLLEFPPAPVPESLSPPVSDHTFARPFSIPPALYNDLLSVNYPITVALVYAVTVSIINQSNKQRNNKPWAFSKTRIFYLFVVLHNIFLAVYSAWTCAGMIHAMMHTWPGIKGDHGLAEVADAMCKMHGPRGLGNAATYNSTTSAWGVTNQSVKLAGFNPDSTDVGRLWNEGLAYYGWLFYLSKFYEVVDTLVILAKGKHSSLLQTFHHAGAMMCVWAGIRYMSPPIWMFVLVNSGLHALMYTYYTLTALSFRVPQVLKRTLTMLQILQLVVGASYALAHLFIAYEIPVSVPYLFVHNLSTAIPSAASSVSSAFVSATATAGVGGWLKKIALRAAGEEGLAENVRNNQGEAFGIDAIHAQEVEKAQEEIRYRNVTQMVHCLDTSGQVFAIWLNLFYLAPLTLLFIDFFVRSYFKRTKATSKRDPDHKHKHVLDNAEKASKDAFKGVERQIHEAMADDQGNEDMAIPPGLADDIKAKAEEAKAGLKKGADKLAKGVKHAATKGKDAAKEAFEDAQDKAKNAASNGEETAKEASDAAKEKVKNAASKGEDAAKDISETVKEKGEDAASKGEEAAKDVSENVKEKGKYAASKGQGAAKDASETAKEKGQNAADKAQDGAKDATETAKEKSNAVKEKSEGAAKEADSKTKSQCASNGGKSTTGGDFERDERAYEVNPDELKDAKERKAEREMQPKPS
ncbi:MAG: hypothetical protein FRX48_04074 [Lasallia pustulata]|uniref:Elongation of fatty acids protein n=1 Tax=Lasallia pustulata TaxID=136370 RepID=A0A5M8PTJ1_9LECA|nr:MAG: hypothetical protein FRX48_04074 [Lasallia pustulata]